MLSVLAFKRSLSAGILDGGGSEISLGGSRLSRFMKEVESVTGQMGEGAAVTPDEELAGAATSSGGAEAKSESSPAPSDADRDAAPAMPPADAAATRNGSATDPWAALVQIGAQVITAFTSTGRADSPAHPWIERDPVTGGQSLKVPLPPPDISRQLADALSVLADRLRGNGA